MNNFGIALLKIVALAGGAVAGALLSNWIDEARRAKSEEHSDYHKTRYAQGLAPMEARPATEE